MNPSYKTFCALCPRVKTSIQKQAFENSFPWRKAMNFHFSHISVSLLKDFFFKPKERFNYPHLPGKDNLNFHPPISGCLDKETKHQI